jgi:hypothetical protein
LRTPVQTKQFEFFKVGLTNCPLLYIRGRARHVKQPSVPAAAAAPDRFQTVATFKNGAASTAPSIAPVTPTLARVIRLIASRTFFIEWRREPCQGMKYSPVQCRSEKTNLRREGPSNDCCAYVVRNPRVARFHFLTLKTRDCTIWPKLRAIDPMDARHWAHACARQQRTRPRAYIKLSSTRFDLQLTPPCAGTSWWQYMASPASYE